MDQKPLSCTNCQAVTTNDGRTLWVCENCGEENQPVEIPAAPEVAPVVEAAAPDPVIPAASAAPAAQTAAPVVEEEESESRVPDASEAQAAITEAASAVEEPVIVQPEQPASAVSPAAPAAAPAAPVVSPAAAPAAAPAAPAAAPAATVNPSTRMQTVDEAPATISGLAPKPQAE